MADFPPVKLDATRITEVEDRSDIDQHQDLKTIRREIAEGAEDWGDGFFVDYEPVVVTRDAGGLITRTTPISEIPWLDADPDENPVVAAPVTAPGPQRTAAEREKLVDVLAMRLFKWYQSQPPSPTQFNPLYDGLPELPPGAPRSLQPLPGTDIYPATPGQVYEWLKAKVIGPRVQLVNKKRGWRGYIGDADANDVSVRISRSPID